jgi:DNA polymerase-3 subunit epsilon
MDITNLSDNWIVLDTETTGLGEDSEIVEISIIDGKSGMTLFDTLVKPLNPVPDEAFAIHGISNDMLLHAPRWPDIHEQIAAILKDKTCVIYNAQYDVRLIKQTSELYGLDFPAFNAVCAMLWYSELWGEISSSHGTIKWQSLVKAARQMSVELPPGMKAHRAMADVIMTRGVILAAKKRIKQGSPFMSHHLQAF